MKIYLDTYFKTIHCYIVYFFILGICANFSPLIPSAHWIQRKLSLYLQRQKVFPNSLISIKKVVKKTLRFYGQADHFNQLFAIFLQT